jgi:selenocysteine lyase/cysteine desulfurase
VSGFRFPPGAARLEYGSSTQLLRVAFADAMRYLQDVGLERIFEHSQRLGDRLITGLEGLGARVVTPRAPEQRAGIVSAAFPGVDSKVLLDRLAQRRVSVLERMGMLRFAPHLFNSGHDIELALQAVAESLRS